MAPPSKRRRLLQSSEDEQEQEVYQHARHGFAHTVTQIDYSSAQTPSIEEVHIQIQDVPMTPLRQQQKNLAARQAVESSSIGESGSTASTAPPTDSAGTSTAISLTTSVSTSSEISGLQSSVLTSSQTIDALSSGISSSAISVTSGLGGISTSSATITSSIPLSTYSSVRNATIAENILTTGLNGTFYNASSRTGLLLSSSRTSSTTKISSSSTTSSEANVLTSVVLTTATLSQDGHAVSTITTQVGAVGYSAPPAPSSTDATIAGSPNRGNADPPPPGTIAGGVVGGAAGLAVLLLVAMLFLRWFRRRSQAAHQALLPGSAGAYHDSEPDVSRNGPGMAERAGLRPWAAAIPALMRHQQDRSTPSVENPSTSERGFQRISGRKLPSAWSPGMEAPPPMPGAEGHRASGTSSFYPDSAKNVNPFEDSSEGPTPDEVTGVARQRSNEHMSVIPGPQRRPTIHNPNRHLAPGDAELKHMSSMARTSGTATTLFQPESNSSHGSQFREQV